jgi:hypothetical protein
MVMVRFLRELLTVSLIVAAKDTEGNNTRASAQVLIQQPEQAYNVQRSHAGCLKENEPLKSAV